MKTCILGLLFLGLTSHAFAQDELALNTTTPDLESRFTKTKSKATKTTQISKRISAFQKVVSNYDITSKQIYTPKKPATYTVVFKEANNVITNVYNKKGEVIASKQKFENVRLPDHISVAILKKYPNWSVKSVKCTIEFKENVQDNISYKIKITNGKQSKVIKA